MIKYVCKVCGDEIPAGEVQEALDGTFEHQYEAELIGEDWKGRYHGPVVEEEV